MFRTSYVHHQEDYIVHAALYGMLFVHLRKHSARLKDVHGHVKRNSTTLIIM